MNANFEVIIFYKYTPVEDPTGFVRWQKKMCEEIGIFGRILIAREGINGTVEGMLGWAHVVVVTSESISMVSEACGSGRHVVAVEPPLRRAGLHHTLTKPQRFVQQLVEHRYLTSHPLPEVGSAIRRALSDRQPVQRLDTYATVREAVKRLL
jgi:hypothetical protein